jgi:arylsulfatase A-like enzyme
MGAPRSLLGTGALVAALALSLAGCRSRAEPTITDEPPRGAPDPATAAPRDAGSPAPSLLIIMIDTLRADRLGAAGYRRNDRSLTPRLDAFAAQAVRFSRAYAHAPNTPRSHPALMASRYPSQIAYHKTFHNFPAVLDDNVLLFEVLRDAGLHTAHVSSSFYFAPQRGVGQGITDYDNTDARSIKDGNFDFAAPRIVPRVIERLERYARDRTRFAMFVHLFEPHSAYLDHPEYPVTTTGVPGLVERYDYEIAVVDAWVGRIFDALAANELDDNTIVVVLSDHGEAFGDHGVAGQRAFFHGQTLYDEILRVPLLVRAPGMAATVRDDLVGLVDVAPTLLDLLGVEPPASFLGRSLAPALRGEPLPPRPLYAELLPTPGWEPPARALVTGDGREKIIVSESNGLEVFDLAADPDERINLARRDRALAERLRAELDRWPAAAAP